MLLFLFHNHASCTPHFIHLRAVHDYALIFFPSILPTAMWLPYVSIPFHGYA